MKKGGQWPPFYFSSLGHSRPTDGASTHSRSFGGNGYVPEVSASFSSSSIVWSVLDSVGNVVVAVLVFISALFLAMLVGRVQYERVITGAFRL